MSTPAITTKTAPFGHPWYGHPLVLVNGVEVAWADSEVGAQGLVDVLTRVPTTALALANPDAADDFVNDPTRGFTTEDVGTRLTLDAGDEWEVTCVDGGAPGLRCLRFA